MSFLADASSRAAACDARKVDLVLFREAPTRESCEPPCRLPSAGRSGLSAEGGAGGAAVKIEDGYGGGWLVVGGMRFTCPLPCVSVFVAAGAG